MKGTACIMGAYEHPTRKADDRSLAQLHAEVAHGALADAGLTKGDVDGYFCAGDAPGLGGLSMADYMGLKLRHIDTTETGGSSYVIHVSHAAQAIAAGKCDVALITLAGRPRAEGMATGTAPRNYGAAAPDVAFEFPFGPTVVNQYAMAISTPCSGKRISRAAYGVPGYSSGFIAMWMLAGNTAINNAIWPQAARRRVDGPSNSTPSTISTTPLAYTSSSGHGR